jgi:hypothetical protein
LTFILSELAAAPGARELATAVAIAMAASLVRLAVRAISTPLLSGWPITWDFGITRDV